MIAVGYVLLVIAGGWIVYKLYVSYSSAGGTDFEIPVYDAAIYPPILGVVGLYLVLRTYDVQWAFWIYLILWIGVTLLTAGAIRGLEELGDKPLR